MGLEAEDGGRGPAAGSHVGRTAPQSLRGTALPTACIQTSAPQTAWQHVSAVLSPRFLVICYHRARRLPAFLGALHRRAHISTWDAYRVAHSARGSQPGVPRGVGSSGLWDPNDPVMPCSLGAGSGPSPPPTHLRTMLQSSVWVPGGPTGGATAILGTGTGSDLCPPSSEMRRAGGAQAAGPGPGHPDRRLEPRAAATRPGTSAARHPHGLPRCPAAACGAWLGGCTGRAGFSPGPRSPSRGACAPGRRPGPGVGLRDAGRRPQRRAAGSRGAPSGGAGAPRRLPAGARSSGCGRTAPAGGWSPTPGREPPSPQAPEAAGLASPPRLSRLQSQLHPCAPGTGTGARRGPRQGSCVRPPGCAGLSRGHAASSPSRNSGPCGGLERRAPRAPSRRHLNPGE